MARLCLKNWCCIPVNYIFVNLTCGKCLNAPMRAIFFRNLFQQKNWRKQVHELAQNLVMSTEKIITDSNVWNEIIFLILFLLSANNTNTSLSGSSFDWLANLDALKESVRLAGSYDWQNIDVTQFQGKKCEEKLHASSKKI